MITPDSPIHMKLWEEDRKVRYLRLLVDLTRQLIAQGQMSGDDARASVRLIRRVALTFFPDKAETFDMIYAPRFQRLLDEVYGPPSDPK